MNCVRRRPAVMPSLERPPASAPSVCCRPTTRHTIPTIPGHSMQHHTIQFNTKPWHMIPTLPYGSVAHRPYHMIHVPPHNPLMIFSASARHTIPLLWRSHTEPKRITDKIQTFFSPGQILLNSAVQLYKNSLTLCLVFKFYLNLKAKLTKDALQLETK